MNYYVHDQQLRSNPPAQKAPQVMATDLYGMQDNIYNKNRPENLAFLERLRALTDQYKDIMMVGEVGEVGMRSINIMGEYTAGTSRLHMAYSFAMLGPDFSADHFRTCIEAFQTGAPDGQPKWSFSNHDVPRHVTRWAEHGVDEAHLARLTCALLMSFEGAIGIYQGEELGQTETELVYEELTDPPALRYWPGIKGRDGCRTPMVWEHAEQNAGFSAGTPWLPVKARQQARAVDVQEAAADSVLKFYRRVIAFRKDQPALSAGKTTFLQTPEPIFAFRRSLDTQAITCVFNLSKSPTELELDHAATLIGPSLASLEGETLKLPGNGFAFLDPANSD